MSLTCRSTQTTTKRLDTTPNKVKKEKGGRRKDNQDQKKRKIGESPQNVDTHLRTISSQKILIVRRIQSPPRYKLVWPWVRTELFRQRVAEFFYRILNLSYVMLIIFHVDSESDRTIYIFLAGEKLRFFSRLGRRKKIVPIGFGIYAKND